MSVNKIMVAVKISVLTHKDHFVVIVENMAMLLMKKTV